MDKYKKRVKEQMFIDIMRKENHKSLYFYCSRTDRPNEQVFYVLDGALGNLHTKKSAASMMTNEKINFFLYKSNAL